MHKLKKRYGVISKSEAGETITQADVKAMQKRIAELEVENEIPKKPAAIFAKTSQQCARLCI